MNTIKIIIIEMGIYLPLAILLLKWIDTKYTGKENKLLVKVILLGLMSFVAMEIAIALVKFNMN